MRATLVLTDADRAAISRFLDRPWPFTKEQYWASYRNWWRGGNAWEVLHEGGTGQMRALMWYQHYHKPGSKEWRPSVIIRELLAAAKASEVPA